MFKKLFTPGALLVAMVAAWEGGFPGEALLLEHFPDIGAWIRSDAARPHLFIGLVGVFIGYVLIPNLIAFINWRGNRADFRSRQHEVFSKHKPEFHHRLREAYTRWASSVPYAPSDLDSALRRSGSLERRELLSMKISRMQNSLLKSNCDIYDFCCKLVSEMEQTNVTPSYRPTLLTREGFINLYSARREIKMFWDREGERIYEGMGIILSHRWLKKIEDDLNDPSIVMLPYIEVALAKNNNVRKMSGRHFMRLCLRGERKWRVENI